ncbi:hypothetical protein QFW96_21445 [Saccharopolyspora sp. TS4A08]|uniref:Uncharacterized protein n=1 Tax=Saccharopolyspora ipomoeae TaxID=3042027 RepID=A0ABT6PU96_9PSEU|nr:hypothetical protein [Saccharopolyspora sp. TS4A08]MDI2031208.1 hypothetical protein [Saccharopolyspora sp. TS4A08]
MAPPKPLRISVVLWWVVALLLLLETGLSWFDPAIEDRLLLVNTVVGIVLAAIYLVLGAMVFRRRAWARLALTIFAAAHLVLMVVSGAGFGIPMLLLALGVAGTVLMWARQSSDWLTGER